ncbi:NUDIX hydrolase [Sandaracinus amylolyticus]|uniref:Putative nudix hydrolase YeaB n=1 Tax=Sandaracinus amylolyticus TaxID=927083 RepID=A0A0F6YI46_9BACT|nr:CoA pyrophosphatase [Sandaracinus amylolyticus]AKF05510.1 Putative nudix hydrolase YeaB [Sandaracinus amylolyticus]
MQPLDLSLVRAALRTQPPHEIDVGTPQPGTEIRYAAVSAILRPGELDGPEVLLIRRAERPSDPWSGHMAFPGGRREPHDPDLQATAVRETREEVGLDLDVHGELLGRLDDAIPGSARGLMTGLVVKPYVWQVHEVPELVPNGVEVDEIHWAPIAPMLRGERDASHEYVWKGQSMRFPGFRVGDGEHPRVVWGLTHRMLTTLFARLRAVMESMR